MPRSRRWTTESGPEAQVGSGRGNTRWEPTLAFPKNGAHRATIGDRLYAEVHIDVKRQQEWSTGDDALDVSGARPPVPFIESIVYDYMGTQGDSTMVIRETSRQGERIEHSTLYVHLNSDMPTKIRFPSGVISVEIDDEQVAIARLLGT